MKILKFGGTSVGSPHGLCCIKEIVSLERGSLVVVVSALGGVTDQLLRIADLAQSQDPAYLAQLDQLKTRHVECVNQSVGQAQQAAAMQQITPLLRELEAVLMGVSLVAELSARTSALVVSYGERLSSIIVHQMLEGSRHLDSRQIFKTRDYFSRYIIDFPHTISLIRSVLSYVDADCGRTVTVLGGFISSDSQTARTTNLGRGGSDYTAALLAGVLDARLLEIYTDVDGFMTADPRIVPGASVIKTLDFVESMELCNYGAKVLYPPTIFPAYNNNIPIVIKNTFNHSLAGTFIDSHPLKQGSLSGISSIKETALITVKAQEAGAVRGRSGTRWLSYRLYRALSRAGISPFFQSLSSLGDLSIGVQGEAVTHQAIEILLGEFAQEIAMGQILRPVPRFDLSTVALVGTAISIQTRTQILSALQKAKIKVVAANPEGDNNVALVVPKDRLNEAIGILHGLFFEKEHRHISLHIKGSPALEQYVLDNNEALVQRQNTRLMLTQGDASCEAEIRVDCVSDSVVRVMDNMALALGVGPLAKQVLQGFTKTADMAALKTADMAADPKTAGIHQADQITYLEALVPANTLELAKFRANLLAQWAAIQINDAKIITPQAFSKTPSPELILIRIQGQNCTIEPQENNNQRLYLKINSSRFPKYPFHIWLEKLSLDAIYSLVLELSDIQG